MIAGRRMLDILRTTKGATCIVAKCPAHLPSNGWYQRRGFVLSGYGETSSGKPINVWKLSL